MVGRLAKWLRILGCDVAFERDAPDERIVRLAERENRVILTRDTRLVLRKRARRFLLIDSDDPAGQLRQVARAFGLRVREDRLLTRCLRCNEPLEAASPGEVRSRVPPYVHATQRSFARCAGCGRVYWSATHIEEIRRRLGRILGPGGPGGAGDPEGT